ncbi:hypothetical protein HMN09_00394400 [Mycena chlorophos]|uniref:PH domain-containing protein n=1 Tax=Mycena chlorophos TaxID=658473 RepID=A0A8H6TDI7_MYCCL|nr:hypothetical protein HMN09_00394400 [Mycena chlorophos]
MAAPPSPQEIHRKLSVHSISHKSPRPHALIPGNESDSDSLDTIVPSGSGSGGVHYSASAHPNLSSIAERRSQSGGEDSEEEDDGDEGAGGWRSAARASPQLNSAEESVIKAGYLWKKGERRKTWKKRWFVLRPAHLAYYKTAAEYQLLRLLELSEVHSCTVVALKRHENTFGLVSPVRTFYLQAKDGPDMQEWVRAIEDARQALQAAASGSASQPIPIPASGGAARGRNRTNAPPPPVTPSPPSHGYSITSSDSEDASPSGPRSYSLSSSQPRQQPPNPAGGTSPSARTPIDPGKTILSGYLMKCGSKRRNWRKRWFVLSAEQLVYSASHMDTKPHRRFPFKEILDALEYELPPQHQQGVSPGTVPPDDGNTQTFKIVTTKRTLLLCAPNEEDEIKWLGAIRALIARRTGVPGDAKSPGATANAASPGSGAASPAQDISPSSSGISGGSGGGSGITGSTSTSLMTRCLGFGAKRPDWLRENRNVLDMRDKIKAFLAAQGMIKGHAGTGPRGSDHALPFLRLDPDSNSNTPSSSESPQSPSLTLSPSEAPRALAHPSSAMRDQPWMPNIDEYDHIQQMRVHSNSPFHESSHSHGSHHDMSLYPAVPYNHTVPWSGHHPTPLAGSSVTAPASSSSFGAHYHATFPEDEFPYLQLSQLDDEDVDQTRTFDVGVGSVDLNNFMHLHIPYKSTPDHLLRYYISKVMGLQYLLVDSDHVEKIVVPSVNAPGFSRDAAMLLASVHMRRSQQLLSFSVLDDDPEMKERYEALNQVLKSPTLANENTALAAISMISTFLFEGGAGAWPEWLGVAYAFAQSVFRNGDPRDVLVTCPESTRFIIKTAIWFDVLAAVTTQEKPMFLPYIRKLFSPLRSGIYDPCAPELSMMGVMGCDSVVVWVLAQASALSVWKREEQKMGRLNVSELVSSAAVLERELAQSVLVTPSSMGLFGGSTTTPTANEEARALSADLFRGATKVYLRSIVSGDFPHVHEIEEAVSETMHIIQSAPRMPPSVVRSTVFAFFVCGALTDDQRKRDAVVNVLRLQGEDPAQSMVGNSPSIIRLLQEGIWAGRRRGAEVRWRDVLKSEQMLLV